MPTLRIEVESIESIAAKIKAERDNLDGIIARLKSINSELDSSWDGVAKEQFIQIYGDWLTELERDSDKLNSVSMFLVSVSRNFRELDEAARAAAAAAAGG